MKKIFKFTCITFISLLLIGCEKRLYEDKDMTKAFIENHQQELAVVEEFTNSKTFQPYFTMFITPKGGGTIETGMAHCSHTIFLEKNLFGSYSLLFEKKDISENGKNAMFQNAEKCLLEAIRLFILNKEQKKSALTLSKDQNVRLNEKFVLQSK